MAVTIKDVAERAGVSTKTVSRVMNGELHVRQSVREAVLQIVAELDYRPNIHARGLSSARSYLLAIFFDDPAWSGYAAEMQRGALMRARARHYHLVVEQLDVGVSGWEEDLAASVQGLRLDGAILTPPLCQHPQVLARLEALGLPYVRISPGQEPGRSGLIEIDEAGAARDITRYLIELGHRDIGFVEGIAHHAATPERRKGFLTAMAEAGLAVRDAWMQPGDFTFLGGLHAGEAMLGSDVRPTAIFASNDDMALGLSVAAAKLGLAIPTDVSIAGFDDAPTARIAWPPMTTIRQPVGEMAAAAVDMLVEPGYRAGPVDAGFARRLDHALIVRESTSAPKLEP
jgi:LacI family transcriptional regulator